MEHSDEILFLTSIQLLGYKTLDKLVNKYDCLEKIYRLKDNDILNCNELNDNQKKIFIEKRKQWNPELYRKHMERGKINLVTIYDKDYPKKLLNIPDPPLQLFYIGKLPIESKPSVSIIGARNCSEYGKNAAKYFASKLAESGVQIISGLASGIDGISQKEAMDAGGSSFGILGSGVDICYPKTNRYIYDELKTKGGIISEFPPGTAAKAFHFPMRNRIISGLSDLVLVVEAREKSGTAITVTMALEQGREVFAVPGRINDALSIGCNKLINEGAGMARNVQDIFDNLSLLYSDVFCKKSSSAKDFTDKAMVNIIDESKNLSDLAKTIGKLIFLEVHDKDVLYEKLKMNNNNITINDIQVGCFELLYNNFAYEEAGKIYIRSS